MKKIKQDTPRVKVSIADINEANAQSQRLVDFAKNYAKRAHDAEHALADMKTSRDVARIAAAIGVLSVLALVVGMVLS